MWLLILLLMLALLFLDLVVVVVVVSKIKTKEKNHHHTPLPARDNIFLFAGSQLTLHAIPTNLSMKWIESVGSIPHPEVVLKYKTPGGKLQRTASSISKGRSMAHWGGEGMKGDKDKSSLF